VRLSGRDASDDKAANKQRHERRGTTIYDKRKSSVKKGREKWKGGVAYTEWNGQQC